MDLTVSHEDGYVLARTAGRIDDSADETFREHLFPLLGQPGTRLVLDLSQSGQLSSRGIGHMVSLVAHANTNSTRVILAGCSSFVLIVLNRCRLDEFFEIAETVPAAVCRILDQPQRPTDSR